MTILQQSKAMLVLFVNCHKKNQEGAVRFQEFLSLLQPLLRKTVYYGQEVTETVRTYDQLADYIYDELSFRTEERNRRRFDSLEYLVIDGNPAFAPWGEDTADVLLLIRKAIAQDKKVLCNGFGHFAAYFCLSTRFDKHHRIAKENSGGQADFEWESSTGSLKVKGKAVANCGVSLAQCSRPFRDKSSQALSKGLTLATKFDYVVFDGKSGTKLLKGISLPFSFYWRSKLFCLPKTASQARVDVLLETERGAPVAFTSGSLLSVQGSCGELLRVVGNWLAQHSNRFFEGSPGQGLQPRQTYQTISFENKMEYRKALSSSTSQLRSRSNFFEKRPQSSKFSTIDFEKPAVRCSGKYETVNERYLREQLEKKGMNFGRSRLIFKGKLSEMEIGNYVQREPSRPPSSHKFREVKRDRWVGGDFANC